MSIFERLARLARAEFNHIKAVVADRDDDAPDDVRARREEDLVRARAELERAEQALKKARRDDGAAAWGRPQAETPGTSDGAAAWGSPDADDPEPERRHEAEAAGGGWGAGYPREVRLAYAALEIPMGSDKARVNDAYRDLLGRYHPDLHAGHPERQRAANEITRRIRESRDRLIAWLDQAR